MKTSELTPVNGRKSFYGKAKVIHEGNILKLQSYSTIVAEYHQDTNKLIINGWFSNTTAAHLNAFLDFCGLPKMNKSEMLLYK